MSSAASARFLVVEWQARSYMDLTDKRLPCGQPRGLPFFVMARTDPTVDRVVAVTENGTEVVLALSPVVARFGLRFAAAEVPPGERPVTIRSERGGSVLEIRHQSVLGTARTLGRRESGTTS
jgi:hypothetical protein